MFNIGPMELLVLAIVGLIVLGPDRLPGLARDAAQLLRTLRDMATGARQQLRDELGPEFADVDLRSLNPRTVVQRAVFGDEVNLSKLNPRNALRDAVFGDDDLRDADPRNAFRDARDALEDDEPVAIDDEPVKPVTMSKEPVERSRVNGSAPRVNGSRPRPRPRPPSSPYDDDAT